MREETRRPSTRDVARAAVESPPLRPEEPATFRGTQPEREPVMTPDEPGRTELFHGDEANGFRSRWEAIQTGFVDEPRAAVEEADSLVAQVTTRVAQIFAEERTGLEARWERGEIVSTEDLRIALKRYRSFFDRLLKM
jgi:hypothetical protein